MSIPVFVGGAVSPLDAPLLTSALTVGELAGAIVQFVIPVGTYYLCPSDGDRIAVSFQLLAFGGPTYVTPLGPDVPGGYRLDNPDFRVDFAAGVPRRIVRGEWYVHVAGGIADVLVQCVRGTDDERPPVAGPQRSPPLARPRSAPPGGVRLVGPPADYPYRRPVPAVNDEWRYPPQKGR
jgi:hypothetical protein